MFFLLSIIYMTCDIPHTTTRNYNHLESKAAILDFHIHPFTNLSKTYSVSKL